MIPPASEYKLAGCISADGIISMYHAMHIPTSSDCILKVPADDLRIEAAVRFLRNEYGICNVIDHETIVRPTRPVHSGNNYFLEFRPMDIIPLGLSAGFGSTGLNLFLDTAIHISELLGTMHDRGVTHGNVTPFSIVKSISAGTLHLTSFYVATTYSDKNLSSSPYYPPGTSYIAPEQSGKVERPVDERTDLYALGCVLYEMLCGEPPFVSDDLSSLIYSHVARKPVLITEKNRDIPLAIAEIIAKLLEKNPTDRYQSAFGVLADFEECRSRFLNGRGYSRFIPGRQDRITRLLPFKKLHGREGALAELTAAFRDAQQGTCGCVLIYGEGGAGKTKLVETMADTLDPRKTFFARGKCEASAAVMPYRALKEAIADLINSIIVRGDDTSSYWRSFFLEQNEDVLKIIADFVPEIKMLTGPVAKRKLPEDGEAGTQFKNAVIQFLRSLVFSDYSLILFIDDLQWADSALLSLLVPAFFEQTSRKLLFIGCSRPPFDNVSLLTRSVVSNSGVKLRTIDLVPLNRADTGSLIADALGLSPAVNHDELDALVYKKTNGNPLFVKTFLETLLAKNLLVHQINHLPLSDPHEGCSEGRWKWHTDAIEQLGCTENVVDLIIEKTGELSSPARRLLDIAACIGLRFDLLFLNTIVQMPKDRFAAVLSEAADAGIIRIEYGSETTGFFCFGHDRIREAIYNRIPHEVRRELHLEAGRKLLVLRDTSPAACSVFDLLKHLNQYSDFITDPQERKIIAQLNSEAAIHSRNANATETAIVHFKAAIGFLDEDEWIKGQEFRFNLELHLAECEFQNSLFDISLNRCQSLEGHAKTENQFTAIDLVRMSIHNHQQRHSEAMSIGIRRLNAMGINFPSRPGILYLAVRMGKAAISMHGLSREIDCSFPSMSSSDKQWFRFRILIRLWLDAFTLQRQRLVIAITTYLINSARRTGIQSPFAVACCFWGIFVGMITRNPLKGMRYGTRALKIADQFDDMFSRGITYFLYGSFFAHLEGDLNTAIKLLVEGKRISYDAGDLVSTSNCAEGILLYQVLNGRSLTAIKQSTVETHEFLSRIGNPHKALTVVRFIQTWTNDIENELHPTFASSIENPDDESPLVKGIFNFYLMFRSVVAGDYSSAFIFSRKLKGSPLLDPTSYFFFFHAFLSVITLSGRHDIHASVKLRLQIRKMMRILKKGTSFSEPTILPLLYCAKAEYCRCTLRRWDALVYYRKAVETARTGSFHHIAALGSERAASFIKPYDLNEYRSQLKNAMMHYYEWGAHAKVTQLRRSAPDVPFNPPAALLSGFNDIDIQALLKSYEAISNELLLDRLLEKLIRIIMENSGAHRGLLLLEENGIFRVRVEGNIRLLDNDKHEVIEVHAHSAVSDEFQLPGGIISYVIHSREPVRLEHAGKSGRFVNDPYITRHSVKSVLCVPLIANDRLRGIFYLENNMTEAAFPPSRLQLLKLLCSQAVISIDNALFHEVEIRHLQAKVNPHFIFNALSSIAELCHTDPVATEDAVVKLSRLYRYVLTAEMRLVTLSEELEIVDNYLAIEKLRFGNRLMCRRVIDGDPSLVRMPSMLIQPLVENSIKHGLSPRPGGGTITVSISITAQYCTVSVSDDGVGSGGSVHQGSGYGLESIKKRLALYYPHEATFRIEDTPGFRVVFSLPLLPQKKQSPVS